MKNKKDIIPLLIAALMAIVVTGIIRWFLPVTIQQENFTQITEIPMPKIPLAPKQRKLEDVEVLVINIPIKKDQKIIQTMVEWRKWPKSNIQPHFIAKDLEGRVLNNGADYNNALKMWAKTDIPAGVPLITAMLTNEDPAQQLKLLQQKKALENEKKEKEIEESLIEPGMRAITFPVDQRTASSSHIMRAGTYVDVLIQEQINGKIKTHIYKKIKILAVDGVLEFRKKEEKKEENSNLTNGSLFGNNSIIGNMLAPKNVTLQVNEMHVEQMIKQVGSGGVILSLRSVKEKNTDKKKTDDTSKDEEEQRDNLFIKSIFNINNIDANSDKEEKELRIAKEKEEKELILLLSNMNSASNNLSNSNNKAINHSKVEFVSGKTIGPDGEEIEKEEPIVYSSLVVYRKLEPKITEFTKGGQKLDAETKKTLEEQRKKKQ